MLLRSGRLAWRFPVDHVPRSLAPLLLLLVLALVSSAWAATTVVVGSDPSKTVIKGTLMTPDQVIDGELVIEGDKITCAAATCPASDAATRISVTNAYIFPGFVDAHNHVAYNILARWTPPKLYERRGQWQAAQAYKDFKKPYADLIDKGLFCEMVKYGEIKALLSGVTTIQGTAPNNMCFRNREPERARPAWQSQPDLHPRYQLVPGGPSTGPSRRASPCTSPRGSAVTRRPDRSSPSSSRRASGRGGPRSFTGPRSRRPNFSRWRRRAPS